MTDLERRNTRHRVEMRGDGAVPRIGGYAAKFDKLSQNLGGFVERIASGFFDTSRDKAWRGVMARYNHEELLATTAAASLRLSLDSTGLDYEADLLDDPTSERVWKLVQRGDVHQSSFAFYVTEDEWGLTEQGFPVRTLIAGELVDVAPVDSPAYLDTSTGLRSLAEARSIDLAEVRSLADAGDLASLIKTPPVVLDLGSPSPTGRSETPVWSTTLDLLRRELREKQAV